MHYAAELGELPYTVLRPLRKVKCPPPNPIAWEHSEIRTLVTEAADLTGGTKRCPYRLLMPAWILAGYSTALRRSDLLGLRHDQIRGQRACVRQKKTMWPIVVYLDEPSLKAMAKLPVLGPRVFGDLISEVQIVRVMRRLVKRCGLQGSSKWLRRSCATYDEIQGLDSSHRLGHKSPQMKAYYVDQALKARHFVPRPPVPILKEG